MRQIFLTNKIKFYIGDIRNYDSVSQAVDGVDYIFHAAALKQVPSCEFYPLEAVRTNILGTENILNAAIARNVKKVVVLSTDKAVYPINAMGMSKALAEKLTIAKSRLLKANSDTILCLTRYGNVMASRGSVIPLFVNQIKAKQSITITDPSMTRFLMSLDDSVRLVMQAFAEASQGDLFVQKSPAAEIGLLANALQEIFCQKVPINIIGTRHGEKLYETLISREEFSHAKDLNSHYKIPPDVRDLNYAKYFSDGDKKISCTLDYTSHNTNRLNLEQLKSLLLNLDFIKEQLNA
jgi:UDP-glucose 4-epimerase